MISLPTNILQYIFIIAVLHLKTLMSFVSVELNFHPLFFFLIPIVLTLATAVSREVFLVIFNVSSDTYLMDVTGCFQEVAGKVLIHLLKITQSHLPHPVNWAS